MERSLLDKLYGLILEKKINMYLENQEDGLNVRLGLQTIGEPWAT